MFIMCIIKFLFLSFLSRVVSDSESAGPRHSPKHMKPLGGEVRALYLFALIEQRVNKSKDMNFYSSKKSWVHSW
jgi:hypothetical protein